MHTDVFRLPMFSPEWPLETRSSAQTNLLWRYSEFKNLSTSHGFAFASVAEDSGCRPFPELPLPGRAFPTVASAHSLRLQPQRTAPQQLLLQALHHPRPGFLLSVTEEPRIAYWRCLKVKRVVPRAPLCFLCSTYVKLPKSKGTCCALWLWLLESL